MKTRIYHNPRCSKSRATLALLEGRAVDLDVVEYLKTPPSKETLSGLISKLGIEPKDLVRSGDAEFKSAGVDLASATDDEVLDLLVRIPRLIQRPIVEVGNHARVGRPPEAVLEILE